MVKVRARVRICVRVWVMVRTSTARVRICVRLGFCVTMRESGSESTIYVGGLDMGHNEGEKEIMGP